MPLHFGYWGHPQNLVPACAPRFARLSTMKLPHTGQTGREGAATRGDAIGPPPTVAFHVPPPVARRRRVIQPPTPPPNHTIAQIPPITHPNISTADLNSGVWTCVVSKAGIRNKPIIATGIDNHGGTWLKNHDSISSMSSKGLVLLLRAMAALSTTQWGAWSKPNPDALQSG